ncbi:hypothetical protein EHS39_32525 [Ensifer sp. MPMI2T]|nr:hypothetical protein EHS39_32525 [Ensifer sp. MPMI2T]
MSKETEAFRPPLPSRATRRISPRSKASLRGALVAQLPADEHPRRIVFESKLEQRVLYLLLARPDVHDIWDQPPAVPYMSTSGREKRHVFDFLVALTNGRRIAVAVKPAELAEKRNFRAELQTIRAATTIAFAHDIVLVTDRSFSPAAARNAARLHDFRRTPDPEADARVRSIIATLADETTIAEVVSMSGLEGRGFRAVYRSLYEGHARALTHGDITPATRIAREVRQ